jgi:hypothetical protein
MVFINGYGFGVKIKSDQVTTKLPPPKIPFRPLQIFERNRPKNERRDEYVSLPLPLHEYVVEGPRIVPSTAKRARNAFEGPGRGPSKAPAPLPKRTLRRDRVFRKNFIFAPA